MLWLTVPKDALPNPVNAILCPSCLTLADLAKRFVASDSDTGRQIETANFVGCRDPDQSIAIGIDNGPGEPCRFTSEYQRITTLIADARKILIGKP